MPTATHISLSITQAVRQSDVVQPLPVSLLGAVEGALNILLWTELEGEEVC